MPAIAFSPPFSRSQAITPWQRPAVLDELPGVELLVDLDPALHELLVEHLDQDVAGDVGREDRARRAGGAERPLRELPVLGAREHRAPVLELVDVARRLAREDLDRVLVGEEVRPLHGVEGVRLGGVLLRVSERRVDAALGGAGMAAGRMQLRDDGDVGSGVERLDRRAHARATGADHEDIVRRFHGHDASGMPGCCASFGGPRRGDLGVDAGELREVLAEHARELGAPSRRRRPDRAQVERGSSSPVSTPGAATGTSKPNTGSMRISALSSAPESTASSSARVSRIGIR